MLSTLSLVLVVVVALFSRRGAIGAPARHPTSEKNSPSDHSALRHSQEFARMSELHAHMVRSEKQRRHVCTWPDRQRCSAHSDPVLCSSKIESSSSKMLPPPSGFNRTFCRRMLFKQTGSRNVCFQELWIPVATESYPGEKILLRVRKTTDDTDRRREITDPLEGRLIGRWVLVNTSMHGQTNDGDLLYRRTKNRIAQEIVVCGRLSFDVTRSPFRVTGFSDEDARVIFAVDDVSRSTQRKSRHRLRRAGNEILSTDNKEHNVSEDVLRNSFAMLEKKPPRTRYGRPPCTLHRLTVDVRRDLGIKQAIFPRKVDLSHCKGHCTKRFKPSTADSYANAHSQLKAILRRTGSPKAAELSGSCCVATETSSLTVLLKINGILQSVPYPNAIAEKCGCS